MYFYETTFYVLPGLPNKHLCIHPLTNCIFSSILRVMAAVCREGRKKILVHVILDLYPEEYASYVGEFYQEDKKRERRRNLEEAT